MGYYTLYSLEVLHVQNEEEFSRLQKYIHENETMDDVFYDGTYCDNAAVFDSKNDAKWYDHTDDMISLSKVFPDMQFRLHGIGEEDNDIWYHYFHNGADEYCPLASQRPINVKWDGDLGYPSASPETVVDVWYDREDIANMLERQGIAITTVNIDKVIEAMDMEKVEEAMMNVFEDYAYKQIEKISECGNFD